MQGSPALGQLAQGRGTLVGLVRAVLLAALSVLCIGSAPEVTPAVLKLRIQVDAGVIKVADLWTSAGAKADAVIGPAPSPGRTITIEAAQLAYIARLYDVEWRPVSGVERSAVERAGRPLTRDELVDSLRRSLVDAGATPTATIEFSNFTPVLVPPSSFPLLMVEQIAYDAAGERFSANMSVATEGMDTQRMRVSGRVMDTVAVVVANRRLTQGDVIAAADVRVAQLPARRISGSVANDLPTVIGQSPRRTIVAGQPLAIADIGPPVMVPKGATVVIVVESPGLSLAAQGLALEAGGRDDVIQVMNPLSRAVVEARVTGPGRAVISPGSSPLVPPVKAAMRNPDVSN